MLGILFSVMAFQAGVIWWQKNYRKSYLTCSLAALWLFPFLISLKERNWRFILVWLCFTAINWFVLKKAMNKNLHATTPRLVYKFYHASFTGTLAIATMGYLLFMLNMFFFSSPKLIDLSLILIFYGLYFGVVSRDLIDFAADHMASTIGYYCKEGSLPNRLLRPNTCSVCGDMVDSSETTSPPPPPPPSSSNDADLEDRPLISWIKGKSVSNSFGVTLNCGHVFHTNCLHGWCLLGKKDICPYCREKVEMGLVHTNPWRDPEFVYGKFLDVIRFMIVGLPVLLYILHLVITFLKRS